MRLLTTVLTVISLAAVCFRGPPVMAQPYAGSAGNYGSGPYDRSTAPVSTTTGVRWESTPAPPLTADAPSSYRATAVEQYRLAQRPAPAATETEAESQATGTANVFDAPPIPGGRRFRTAPDLPAESPFAPPPPPSATGSLPPRETWPPAHAEYPPHDAVPPPHPPAAPPGGDSPNRDGRSFWDQEYDPSQPPMGEPYPTDRFADTRPDFATRPPPAPQRTEPAGNPRALGPQREPTASREPSAGGSFVRDEAGNLRYQPHGADADLRLHRGSISGDRQGLAAARYGPLATGPQAGQVGDPPKHSPSQPHDAHSMLGSFEPAKLLALVGNQPILAGDLLPQINQFLKANADKMPPGAFEANKDRWLKMVLEQSIETKLAFVDFLRKIPPERLDFVQGKIMEQFDETELPKALQKAEVKTPAELDTKLREFGSSLDKQRRMFAEQVMAYEMIRENVKRDQEVTHQEMLDYYRGHEDEFRVEARARWEHLCARFSEFPDKDAAWRATVEMGNEVLRGAPLDAVARRRSQGFDAKDGGLNDWTTKNSLRSEQLDKAVFSLPLNRMSEIIEDEDGFHIVRVIEREPDGLVPFVEAQVQIKEAIQKERFEEQKTAYLNRLREKTTIWTAYDDEPSAGLSTRPNSDGSRPSPY